MNKDKIKEIIEDLRDEAQLVIMEDEEFFEEFKKGENGDIRRDIVDINFESIYKALMEIEKIVNK